MKKILFMCLITLGIVFTSCNFKGPSQLKMLNNPEYYADGNRHFEIISVINDSMGFAAEDFITFGMSGNDEIDCVVITNEILYDNKTIFGGICGEWQTVGVWKGIKEIYPVIKFYEYDSLECIKHVEFKRQMDSTMKEKLDEDAYNLWKL